MDYSVYIDACKQAQDYLEGLKGAENSFKAVVDRLFAQNNEAVVFTARSVGGKSMDRGYYCPSTIRDLITVGQSRGRLLKRPRPTSTPSFCYGFDQGGRLLTVQTLNEQSGRIMRKEAVVYEGQNRYGIGVDEDGGQVTLCVCRYKEECILSYRLYFYKEGVGVNRYLAEDYNRMQRGCAHVTCYEFLLQSGAEEGARTSRILDRRRYECTVKDGALVGCVQVDFDNEGNELPPFEVPIFKRAGRKVAI